MSWIISRSKEVNKKQPKDNAYIYFAFKGAW